MVGKLIDHTIDEDFEDLSERLFGEGNCFNSSEVRKRMYGMRTIIEAIDRETVDAIKDEDILDDLDSKRRELQKERQRFSDQRREYNKLLASEGRKEHLEDCLIAAANKLSETVGRVYEYGTTYDRHGLYELPNAEAVLFLCDWHYGMTTDNVWNTYNTEVCKERVRKIVDMAKQRICMHGCHKLHIAVLGDMFHGAIHTSARVASEELVCEQLMNVAEILAQSIEELSECVGETIVYITYGNHARTVQKKEENVHRDNMERIIPWWLTQRLKERDDIIIARESATEFLFINACGYEICASHGDLDSVRTAPRLLPSLFQKKYGKDISYIVLADKHHRESFEELGVGAEVCGSLCGTDEYANGKRLYSTPEQLLLVVTEDVGVDANYHLKCG